MKPQAGWLASLRERLPFGYVDVGTVASGTLMRNALRGGLMILVAAFLAPPLMGVLRSVYAFFKITESLCSFGLDYATRTFVPAERRRGDPGEAVRVLRVVLGLKLLITLALLLLGNLLAPWITVQVFSDPSLVGYVRLVFFAVGGQLLWKHVSSYLSSTEAFGSLALFFTSTPLLMLIVAGGLMLAGGFTLHAAILVYLLTPAVIALAWWIFLRPGLPGRPMWHRPLIRRIVRFSRWVYVTSVASSTRNHINPLLLKNARLSGSVAQGEANAGLYAFGNDLANEITIVSQSLMTVLLPKAAGRTELAALRSFVARSYRHLVLALVPLVLLIFAAQPALVLLGRIRPTYLEYLPSIPVFIILYTGVLVSLLAVPMQSAIYSLRRPQIEAGIELAMLPVLIGGGILLIPRFGAEGAAIMVLVQRVVMTGALLVYGLSLLRGDRTRETR